MIGAPTATGRPASVWSRLSERQRLAALGLLAAACAAVGLTGADVGRALVGCFALAVFALVALSTRVTALSMVIVWLVLLGFVRRFLIPFIGWSVNDPLLLVSPAAAVVLLVTSRHEKPPPTTLLSSLFVFQVLWVVASITNPAEPSLVVAVRGAMYYLIPFLWFFVGRRLTPPEQQQVLRVVLWMAVPVVAHGLYQTFVGLLPFEYTWLHAANVDAGLIFVNGFNIRPFSTFVSPQEYGLFLVFVALLLWSRVLHADERRGRDLAAFSVVVVTMFLQGSRGIFLAFLAAIVIVTAVHARSMRVAVSAAFIVIVGGVLLLRAFAPTATGRPSSTADALIQHQLTGLSNPRQSTAPLHLELVVDGFERGLRNPLGLGPSRGSIAEVKAGQRRETSPENELPITIGALGIPAAVCLLLIYVTNLVYAWRVHRAAPTVLHLGWLAILVAAGDQAFNGRLYCTSMIVALVAGCVSTSEANRRRTREGHAVAA